MATRVFVDANILFSKTLRDWLFLLRNASEGRMYTVGSSEDVLAETIARFRDAKPRISGTQIAALRSHLTEQLDEVVAKYVVRDWMVVVDEGDAHVRAAATDGGFHKLLACDKGLLADDELDHPVSYEPIHPDEFFVLVDDSAPQMVKEVMNVQVPYYLDKHGEADLPLYLEHADCPMFAERVRAHLQRQM